jgi:hypothetical protein
LTPGNVLNYPAGYFRRILSGAISHVEIIANIPRTRQRRLYVGNRKQDQIRLLKMNQAPENRFTREFIAELNQALDEIEKDSSTGA